jgi:hypothetical protein
MERVCCSIASWIVARSCSRMLANSSMQQTPPLAKTKAPASRLQSLPSRTAVHVSPAPVVPTPLWKERKGKERVE